MEKKDVNDIVFELNKEIEIGCGCPMCETKRKAIYTIVELQKQYANVRDWEAVKTVARFEGIPVEVTESDKNEKPRFSLSYDYRTFDVE